MRQWWTSLIARAIALLLIGLALTSAVVGSVFARIQSNRFRVEVERRGTSMLQVLDRHQDLRLALSLHDGRATEEVLGQVLGSNSDIAYLGAVEKRRGRSSPGRPAEYPSAPCRITTWAANRRAPTSPPAVSPAA